jgi:hypothetical protein
MLTLAFADGKAPVHLTAQQGTPWLDDQGSVCAWTFSRDDLHWIDCPGLGVFAFSAGSREVQVWPKPDGKRAAVIDAFSRLLQPVILQALGWVALHASAVAGPAGAFAFCGRSGSGKSTLAFAFCQEGWRQLADDGLVLRLDRDRVMTCPLPFRPRLRAGSRAHFVRARMNLSPAPEWQTTEVPLTAVFMLRQDATLASPRISPVPKVRAFSQLLPYAHCFDTEDPKHTRRFIHDYLCLSARVPVYTLDYRPEFKNLPQLMCAVIAAARGTTFSSGSPSPAKLTRSC